MSKIKTCQKLSGWGRALHFSRSILILKSMDWQLKICTRFSRYLTSNHDNQNTYQTFGVTWLQKNRSCRPISKNCMFHKERPQCIFGCRNSSPVSIRISTAITTFRKLITKRFISICFSILALILPSTNLAKIIQELPK